MSDRTIGGATRAKEDWRRIVIAMNAEEVHDFLTPDEERRWLRSIADHLLETRKSTRPLSREETLGRLVIVLAESRGEPPTRRGKR